MRVRQLLFIGVLILNWVLSGRVNAADPLSDPFRFLADAATGGEIKDSETEKCMTQCAPYSKILKGGANPDLDQVRNRAFSQLDEISKNREIAQYCLTKETNAKFDDCQKKFTEHWGMVAPRCAAISLLEKGRDELAGVASAYAGAAVVCWGACFSNALQAIPVAGQFLAAHSALGCMLASGGATIKDIWATVSVDQEGNKLQDSLAKKWMTGIGGTLGTGAAAWQVFGQGAQAGAGQAGGAGGQAAGAAAQKTAEKTTEKVTEKAAEKVGEKVAEKAAESGAQKAGEGAAQQAFSCVSAGLLTITSAIKWDSYFRAKGAYRDNCKELEDFKSEAPVFAQKSVSSSGGSGGVASFGSTPPANTPGAPNAAIDSAKPSPSPDQPINGQDFAHAVGAVATKDPILNKLIPSMPNRDKMPAVLKGLGTSLPDLARRGMSGGVSAAIGGVPGLPSAAKELVKDIDKMVQEELSQYDSAALARSSGGGGSGGSAGAKSDTAQPFNPFDFFSKKNPTEGGSTDLNLGQRMKKSSDMSENMDIWHTYGNLTLFQIVSSKIVKTRDRVEQLEWSTPLNRALAGLPAKAKEGKSK